MGKFGNTTRVSLYLKPNLIKQTENKTTMNKFKKKLLFQCIMLLGILSLPVGKLWSQCNITFSGNLCIGAAITFNASTASPAGPHQWDFNGEGSSTASNTGVSFNFLTGGAKVIKYIGKNLAGQPCTASLNLTIRENPKINIKLISPPDQCYKNNRFCFRDSTVHPSGAKIVKSDWLVENTQSVSNATFPRTVCFSIRNPQGGTFDMVVQHEDEFGCFSNVKLPGVLTVSEQIQPDFAPITPQTGCDSVVVNFLNRSRIAQSQVSSIRWEMRKQGTPPGPWTLLSTSWTNVRHVFKGQGNYDIRVVLAQNNGCQDTAIRQGIVQVTDINTRIIADKDSTCISDPTIKFNVTNIPNNGQVVQWVFGDPPSGPRNVDRTGTWGPEHAFTGLGPYQVKLTYRARCGNTTVQKDVYDTILIIGPATAIEAPFQRLNQAQVFQCPPKHDTVFFNKNLSTFYHNDKNFRDDDSSFFAKHYWDSTFLGHYFDAAQDPLDNDNFKVPSRRGKDWCVERLWTFADNYALRCTTDTRLNRNSLTNCNASRDSLPWHVYPNWDNIMMNDQFKFAPMQDAIYIDSNGLCKRINIFPSDSFYIFEDSILAVPKNAADYATAANAPWRNLQYRHLLKKWGLKGPAEQYVEEPVDIFIPAGTTARISFETTPGLYTNHTGPKTLKLKRKDVITLVNKTDSITFLWTLTVKRDTLSKPLYQLRISRGDRPKLVGKYKRTFNGIKGFDYDINYNRYRQLFYARIPQCNTVRLYHKDHCHPLKCESQATKSIAIMPANAGGVGSGLLKESINCLGNKNPQYGITFVLSDLKPGCTFSYVAINPDSWCDPNGFRPLTALSPGNRPPGPPYMGYQIAGNPPSRYSMNYSASMVCSPNQCINVGIIVGNGGPVGGKPECADTQWYPNFACFPLLDPDFEILTPRPNAVGNRKICKWDKVVVRTTGRNKTNTRDLKSMRWELATGNASPYFNQIWRNYIQEDYYHAQRVPGKDPKKLYNYMIQTRGGENPRQVRGTNTWVGGTPFSEVGDTLFTAEISKWDTFADVSAAWENVKERLDAAGFDPFSLTGTQIARMIWNRVGTIGQPNTGARGCIDTTGFGKLIKFVFRPLQKKILHYRDTSVRPLDSALYLGKFTKAYTFVPRWSGYHVVALSMTSADGNCDDFLAYPIIVGFGMSLEFNDSIICKDQADNLRARPDYKYFHPDPNNIPNPPFDDYDYWRDPARIHGDPNREGFTKWDWNKRDDDVNNPITIFTGGDYGATGVGTTANPWKQLGGGSLYYKGDSGVYSFRNIAEDSTGCKDTIERKLFITRLDVDFNLLLDAGNCQRLLTFKDLAVLHDPCKWAQPKDLFPNGCDFITEWDIDWGDGTQKYFVQRRNLSEKGIDSNIKHNYFEYGRYVVRYRIKTDQGCEQSDSLVIIFPGPKPKFEFATKAGRTATICVDEFLDFNNLSDSTSNAPVWVWKFGDGGVSSSGAPTIKHQYTKAGTYNVFLTLQDSVIIGNTIRQVCAMTYPDTPRQQMFTVIVKPRDEIKGALKDSVICVRDFNTFYDRSGDSFASSKWIFENLETGSIDTISESKDSLIRQFNTKGRYRVTLISQYDPAKPQPWCPTQPVVLTFRVEEIVADFNEILPQNKPVFKFNRVTNGGVEYRWGFMHTSNITTNGGDFKEVLNTMDQNVQYNYKKDTGKFWVCLIAKSPNGCLDTVCKEIYNDFTSDIRIANVFTPKRPGTANGDTYNDLWEVIISGQDKYSVKIFNRWGEKVFETENPSISWNGKVFNTGADCPEGTYFYHIDYRMRGEKKVVSVKGPVQLIREN